MTISWPLLGNNTVADDWPHDPNSPSQQSMPDIPTFPSIHAPRPSSSSVVWRTCETVCNILIIFLATKSLYYFLEAVNTCSKWILIDSTKNILSSVTRNGLPIMRRWADILFLPIGCCTLNTKYFSVSKTLSLNFSYKSSLQSLKKPHQTFYFNINLPKRFGFFSSVNKKKIEVLSSLVLRTEFYCV